MPSRTAKVSVVAPERFNEAQAIPPRVPDPLRLTTTQVYFPCFPAAIRYRVARDPVTGIDRVVDTGLVPTSAGWNWAVCHAGSWVQRRHHYCWVAGHKRHHIPPVRWVKSGNKVAIVPIHPYDVKGRPPINRKEQVFALNNKNGLSVERVKFEPGRPILDAANDRLRIDTRQLGHRDDTIR